MYVTDDIIPPGINVRKEVTKTMLKFFDMGTSLVVQWSTCRCRASLVAQRLKHLPTMWETWVRFLSQEDPLEKEMATHSSILVWRIPWMEEPGRLQSMGLQRVGHD